MYDFAEAAKKLRISESTLRKWVAKRRVQHHRLGRLVRFTDDDIEAAVTDLLERGVEVHRLPHIAGSGHQAFLHDPFGNLIELNQPEEQFK